MIISTVKKVKINPHIVFLFTKLQISTLMLKFTKISTPLTLKLTFKPNGELVRVVNGEYLFEVVYPLPGVEVHCRREHKHRDTGQRRVI